MTHDMLIDKDIVAVKVAIDTCNDFELKPCILLAPDYDSDSNEFCLQQWNENIEKIAKKILGSKNLSERVYKRALGVVLPIGMRMVSWAEYHEGLIGFSRSFSDHFLDSSFFTQHGIIDNKKAAEILMKTSLSVEAKYKLACIYCFTENIPVLYKQMMEEDKAKFYSPTSECIKQPGLVKFWSYYLMGKVDKIKGEKVLHQYLLEKAVESGSKAAVEFCLEKTMVAVVDAALEAVRNRIIMDDWIVIRDKRYNERKESWVPKDYYTDILCFLMSKMKEDDQIEFLKKDIVGINYKEESLEGHRRSRVLEYFLSWPYQDYFMKTAELMWEFLPEKNYAILLLKVCYRIEHENPENINSIDENSYDYRKLLKKFWCQSPERYKRYVFSNQDVAFKTSRLVTVKTGVGLLTKLLTLKNFTHEDEENIRLILAFATYKERENIVSSENMKNICFELMKKENYGILDWIVLNCFKTKEQANEFKRGMISTKDSQLFCIDLVKNNRCDTAESCIKWCSSSEDEVNQLKNNMIDSTYGSQVCLNLFQSEKLADLDRFIRWHISSEGEINMFSICHKHIVSSKNWENICFELMKKGNYAMLDWIVLNCFKTKEQANEFKRGMISTKDSQLFCIDLVKNNRCDTAESCIKWGSSSEDEINHLKNKMIDSAYGSQVCLNLFQSEKLADLDRFIRWHISSEGEINMFSICHKHIVSSKNWENICFELMKKGNYAMLDWIVLNCFKTKEQANEFKRGMISTKDSQLFCIDLVKNNKCDTAESCIKWGSSSEDEINHLKNKMIDSAYGSQVCLKLFQSEKLVDLDRFIRWHISSEEEINTFKQELIFTVDGVFKCADLVRKGKLDLVSEYINVCLSSEKDIIKLKKHVAYRMGSWVFEELISYYSEEDYNDYESFNIISQTTIFKESKWEEVEKFLTWCLLSEEEISDFKKNVLLKMTGVKIHFNLIQSHQWEEAETFFAWLGLSTEEIKELKKDTLFHHEAAGDMFSELMYSKEGDERFVDYGSKQEAIELLLRWYLTDKETILEFKEKFKRENQDVTENNDAVLANFDLAIAQRLIDLDTETIRVKRKSESIYPSKRFCNLQHEIRGLEYEK